MRIQAVSISTPDGYTLSASEFTPETSNGVAVILNGATGVLKKYYQSFAEHLCQQGFTILTYEYRGIGNSTQAEKDAPQPSMIHWGQIDMDVVLQYFSNKHPTLTMKGIGHSIGGQLLGMLPNNNRYKGFLNIAAQHIYWKNWPTKDRAITVLFFFFVLPFFAAFNGLPKWVLGAEYLPKKVVKDWSRFGRKDIYTDHNNQNLTDGFHAYEGKMRFLSMDDDILFAPKNGVKGLQSLFKNAKSDLLILKPKDYEMHKIDHFGFFKSNMNKQAWLECSEWLKEN